MTTENFKSLLTNAQLKNRKIETFSYLGELLENALYVSFDTRKRYDEDTFRLWLDKDFCFDVTINIFVYLIHMLPDYDFILRKNKMTALPNYDNNEVDIYLSYSKKGMK